MALNISLVDLYGHGEMISPTVLRVTYLHIVWLAFLECLPLRMSFPAISVFEVIFERRRRVNLDDILSSCGIVGNVGHVHVADIITRHVELVLGVSGRNEPSFPDLTVPVGEVFVLLKLELQVLRSDPL